ACLVAAGAAVPGLGDDVPAGQRIAVEDGDEPGFIGLRWSSERDTQTKRGKEESFHSDAAIMRPPPPEASPQRKGGRAGLLPPRDAFNRNGGFIRLGVSSPGLRGG